MRKWQAVDWSGGETDWRAARDRDVASSRKVRPMTPNQQAYASAMEAARVVLCVGPAGSGKTYLACAKAVEFLTAGLVERIVISRPLRECDEEVGTLPGGTWEKTEDMLRPLTEAVEEMVGGEAEVRAMLADGRLVARPLAKLRGATMKNAFVILDEAQNATYRQLRMFLTRLGRGSRMVVCGDHTQSDLSSREGNSLRRVLSRVEPDAHESVAVVRMTLDDVVRDELVRWLEGRLGPRFDDGVEGRDMVETCVVCWARP